MSHCDHCNVDLPDAPRLCPLCQNVPTGAPDGECRFPPLPRPENPPGRILLAKIGFGSVCAVAVCATVNLIMPSGGWWSLFVLAGIACLWADFAVMFRKRKNIPKSILWQVAIVFLIAHLWDRFTGFLGWSVDYVFPLLCTCALIAMTLAAKIQRLPIRNYILYLVLDCILGIVSFVLILAGVVSAVLPSAICFCASVIFFAALLFFQGDALWAEFQRRMHL
ncbi:MAG: DUF6320 domain-containing protein [Clostridiales Family XIII bacterium]|jgi:hypothetical protein|nr:DUF6320 domain-containing protein [Clostridiales Family XIII bacterium]